jgi:Zn-finger nucleic acid-binding protein
MKCPNCNDQALVMSERQGVEIDYCPSCRGIWLDRGELDKLLERAGSVQQAANQPAYREHRPYKQKSWLNEIFD